ncbi:MAG: sulfite exporter TauE/SafE family protein [Gammaproteobacteria bacterium]|nr:sulfite exporter TauE/SafE family protein [Gammaproteobacteria bacterium]
MIEALFLYAGLGIFAGIIAGFLGVGGGLIIVPVLVAIFQGQGFDTNSLMHLAIGTSLATIVFTSISSVYAHHRRGAVLWPVFWKMTSGIVAGALLGAVIADLVPGDQLRMVFGVFELIVAAYMAWNVIPSPHRDLPGQILLTITGMLIGVVSSVIGIGGGTMTVPFLIWCNVSISKAVATSSACGLPIALAGATGFMMTGWSEPTLPEWSTGYIYWPSFFGIIATSIVFAPVGARLTHVLPVMVTKRFFALFLGMLGIHMLTG